MSKSVAIIGCGWLGLPLAVSLLREGYRVHGSTTSQEKIELLRDKGINPFLISLSEDAIAGNISGFLSDVTVLIINVPPKLRGGGSENYVKKMQVLLREVLKSQVERVVFVSSTSVYGDIAGEVTEETKPKPISESGRQLLEAEKHFKNEKSLKSTIVRFGGLIGPNRHPVKMLSGRKGLANGNAPVNLIHLNDCIEIITKILNHNWWNELINGVHPDHPSKKEYYTFKALEMGLQTPDYKEDTVEKDRKIVPKVLQNVKNYTFITSL